MLDQESVKTRADRAGRTWASPRVGVIGPHRLFCRSNPSYESWLGLSERFRAFR